MQIFFAFFSDIGLANSASWQIRKSRQQTHIHRSFEVLASLGSKFRMLKYMGFVCCFKNPIDVSTPRLGNMFCDKKTKIVWIFPIFILVELFQSPVNSTPFVTNESRHKRGGAIGPWPAG